MAFNPIKKTKNQLNKITRYLENRRAKQFKLDLKHCGQNVFIQQPVRFEGKDHISIGNDVSINAFVHIWGQGGVEIGNDTLIASHVAIVSVTHNVNASLYRQNITTQKVIIGKNVWIGTHATILQGVTICDNVIVAAGAVVTKDVPANVIVAGVPAKIIKQKIVDANGGQ